MERRFVTPGVVRFCILAALVLCVATSTASADKSAGFRRWLGLKPKPKAASQAVVPIAWQPDLKSAHLEAQRTGRPILVVVCGPRCRYCDKLKMETLGDRSLATYINTSFVPVLLSGRTAEERHAVKVLDVQAFPTTIILSPEIEVLQSVEGFVRPAEFTRSLHLALDEHRAQRAETTVGYEVER